MRLVAEPGWRAVAYWARHSGGGWEIQGAWCWTREHRQPWPVEVRDLIALVGSGQAPQPPVVPAPPAPPVRRCAAMTPDEALDRLRREWPRARAAERQEITETAAAVKVVRDAPTVADWGDPVAELLRLLAVRRHLNRPR